MRFMVFVITQTSETGAMPSQDLIDAMGKYNQELAFRVRTRPWFDVLALWTL